MASLAFKIDGMYRSMPAPNQLLISVELCVSAPDVSGTACRAARTVGSVSLGNAFYSCWSFFSMLPFFF